MEQEKKEKILFVCLGNICRSPLAEALMREIQTKYKLGFTLDSAGTSGYHIGQKPDARTCANALKNGIDMSNLRARQFVAGDFDSFDRIYAMDKNNLADLRKASKNPAHSHKLSLLPHPETEGEFVEIPDPYYGDENDFESVFLLLNRSIHSLCTKLSKAD